MQALICLIKKTYLVRVGGGRRGGGSKESITLIRSFTPLHTEQLGSLSMLFAEINIFFALRPANKQQFVQLH